MYVIEELPISVQKMYTKRNKTRKVTMMISWGLILIFFIGGTIIDISGGVFNFISELEGALCFGAAIHGLAHSGVIMRLVFGKIKYLFLGIGIIVGWLFIVPVIVVFVLLLACCLYFGFVFTIIDTVRFIKNKKDASYVYGWEISYFLKTPQAVAEMNAAAAAEEQLQIHAEALRVNTAENMQNLKQMFDQGLITEEEYNAKKAELLSRM